VLELFSMSVLETEKFAMKAAAGLFKDYPHYPSVKRRPLLNEMAQTPPQILKTVKQDYLINLRPQWRKGA